MKQNTGTLQITGSGSGFSGPVSITGGRLDVPANFAAASITVADGAALGGEPTVASVSLGTTTGSTLFVNGATAGALTAANLNLNGTTTVDFSVAPTSTAGPIPVLNYGNQNGALTFALANAASYRAASFDLSNAGTVLLNLTTKSLTFSGTSGAAWDVNTTTNWTDAASAPEKFFAGDTVTFGDGPAQLAVTVASGVAPFKTTVSSNSNNYTLTSTGNGIAGAGNLEKSGASTLTLVGPNTYSGQTIVSGGTISFAAANSLGNGGSTNSIALSNGGKLSYTGATTLDLGINRPIAVGTGGGALVHNNATAATINVPGNLSGNGSLSFASAAAGAGTFVLSGDNSGYAGSISVDAPAAVAGGLTVLRIANQISAPTTGSITLNYPAAATTTGNAVTLDLPNIALPATVGLNLTAFLNGAIGQRSQVTSTGNASINGPITLTGNAGAVVQFTPSLGTLTVNGNITEATPGSFGSSSNLGVLFFRNTGNTVVNGTINLPNALVSRVDATGITTINSTGNVWAETDVRSASTLRIGANNALAVGALLTIGQTSDASASIFDLNGFNQEVNGLRSNAGSGSNTRGVTNSSVTLSTLTLNSTIDRTFGNSTGSTGGNLTGNLALVKNGTNIQTIAGPANTYIGNVTVNAGTLVAGGIASSNALGSPTAAGRFVTVNSPGALSFTTNNVLGNGVGNNNLPTIVLNGSTLSSTRYNVLGNVTLNGATLTQASTDASSYEGYQFRGTVSVIGTAPSTISTTTGKADHLAANTVFDVANVTGDAATDLTISAPLRSQSGDFGLAAGGLTKVNTGTLTITGTQSYATLNQNDGTTNLERSLPSAVITAIGGTLNVKANATNSAVNVTTSAANFSADQTLAALNIGDGGVATIVSATAPEVPAFAAGDEATAALAASGAPQAVPEPGSIALLLTGALSLLGRRRRLA